jgi:hypothetical protein
VIEPYLVYLLGTTFPSQFEASTILHLQNKVWFGGSYRQNFGISGMVGLHINKLLTVGYTYTFKNTGTNKISYPSHEIQLGFLFGKRQKNSMMYSFVDTEVEKKKKTPVQLAAEKKKAEELRKAAAEKQKQVAKKEPEPVKQKPVNTDSIARAQKIAEEVRLQEEQEREMLARLDAHLKDSIAHLSDTPPPVERHEFVKRGNHAKEMDLADYVIVGAFRAEANAKNFDQQLIKIGFPEAEYGFLTARNLWYVYIASSENINDARAKRDKYRETKMFKDAWLLTVHE